MDGVKRLGFGLGIIRPRHLGVTALNPTYALLLIIWMAVVLLASGCSQPGSNFPSAIEIPENSPTFTSQGSLIATSAPPVPVSSSQEILTAAPTITLSCEPTIFQVTTQAVEYYFWSPAGDFLYFTYNWPQYYDEDVDWWSYEVESREIRLVSAPPESSPLNLPDHISELATDVTNSPLYDTSPDGATAYLVELILFGSPQSYHVFVSPSKERVFLADEIVTVPVPTLDPTQSLAGESSGNPNPVYQDIYYFPEGAVTPDFYGRIQGRAYRVMWSPDESIAIIEMDMHAPVPPGPAYYWVVDISERNISPLFLFDPYTQPTPLVWGISPDNQWILYKLRDDEFFSVRNLETGVDLQLDLPPAGWVQWLDNRKLLAFGSYDYEGGLGIPSFSLYLYDIYTRQVTRVLDQEFRVSIWNGNAVAFSPGNERLAFIQEGSENLYVITFCLEQFASP